MKKRTLIICVIGALAITAVGVSFAANRDVGSHQTQAVQPPSPDQLKQVRTLALQIAANNGEQAPSNLRVVATTFTAALAADTGATAPSGQEVFMVSMAGHFTGNGFDVPPGAAQPTGSVITFEFDPAAGSVVGLSIGDITPDLAQLGQVIPL